MEAEFRHAHVRLKALINKDAPPSALTELGFITWTGADGWRWNVTADLRVLLYPKRLLEVNGFIAVSFLGALEKREGKPFGVYGPFVDFNMVRGHIVAPIKEATEADLKILDWELDEWWT